MYFRFTLSNTNLGSLVINEPGGWRDIEVVLTRHEEFHSLIESLDSDFIFYGRNNEVNGGSEFIKTALASYGINTKILLTIDRSYNGYYYDGEYIGYDYEVFYTGLIDNESIEYLPNNKIKANIIRDDFWSKFISRLDTPVNVMSTEDLDGNAISAAEPITLTMPSQILRKNYDAVWGENTDFTIFNLNTDKYGAIDFAKESLREIEDKFVLLRTETPDKPPPLFTLKYAGDYDIDIFISASTAFILGASIDSEVKAFIQFNDDAAIEMTRTNVVDVDSYTTFEYADTVTLTANSTITIYFWKDGSTVATQWGVYGTSYMTIVGDTEYPETTCEAFLIHDLFDAIIKRIIGPTGSLYSELFGAYFTRARQYDDDGCYSKYAIAKGLHIRGYTLDEKDFAISFNQCWKGANPIFNLGLGYETIDGDQVIRIETKAHFYQHDDTLQIGNIPDPIKTYDKDRIFNKVEIGYAQWESEESIDEIQTKLIYSTILERNGKTATIHSDFIAGGLTIEGTRRKKLEKGKDYRFDNNNFIFCLSQDYTSPDFIAADAQGEGFVLVDGFNNELTRYNVKITPARNLLRWANYLSIGLQDYPTSNYKFVSGEGNYNALTGLNDACPEDNAFGMFSVQENGEINIFGDSIDYTNNAMHRAELVAINAPLEFEDYEEIKNNRKYSIGISQQSTGFTSFFIKELRHRIFRGEVSITAWPKTPFEVDFIESEVTTPTCIPPFDDGISEVIETCYRITETGLTRHTEDGNNRIREDC